MPFRALCLTVLLVASGAVAADTGAGYPKAPGQDAGLAQASDDHDAYGRLWPLAWTSKFVAVHDQSGMLSSPNPLEWPAFVVCRDKVVRVERLEEVSLTDPKAPALRGGRAHEYRLPCAALLVLGAEVEGLSVGPAKPMPFGVPPRRKVEPGDGGSKVLFGPVVAEGILRGTSPVRLDECRLRFPGRTPLELKHRSCNVGFVGDLNADGRPDFVIDGYGEMGCGARTLYLSNDDGWSEVARHERNC